jgi:hypothetical protein
MPNPSGATAAQTSWCGECGHKLETPKLICWRCYDLYENIEPPDDDIDIESYPGDCYVVDSLMKVGFTEERAIAEARAPGYIHSALGEELWCDDGLAHILSDRYAR